MAPAVETIKVPCLTGEIVRRITGKSVGTFFRNNVAEPLGADFHIGLSAEHDARTSDMYSVLIGNKAAAVRKPGESGRDTTASAAFAEFARRMQGPTTMQWAAFLNPPEDPDAVNTRAWRAAEIPAVNGHGTARALARIYGALARGGEIDGVRIRQARLLTEVRRLAPPDQRRKSRVQVRRRSQ
jgi:CubicO group peptidase (beta-lactamase class C family)